MYASGPLKDELLDQLEIGLSDCLSNCLKAWSSRAVLGMYFQGAHGLHEVAFRLELPAAGSALKAGLPEWVLAQ